MKKCCNNKVKFITNGLSTYAMCALLLSLVGSGIISIFNLSGNSHLFLHSIFIC